MYFLSLQLHGIISAVEALQDEAIMERLAKYIDAMVASARDLNDDGFPEWGPLLNDAPNQLNNFQGCAPIARAAAVVAESPKLRAEYSDKAREWVAYVDRSVIQYWYIKRYRGKIPWLPEDLGGWATYPTWSDKASHLGSIATNLYRATGKPLYRDIALRVGRGFKRKLSPHGEGWIWDNGTVDLPDNHEPVPDTSHANREPRMMVEMYEAGLVFTRSDVVRMGRTLTDTIWNGSLTSPLFSNYINGSNAQYRRYTEPGENGTVYDGWPFPGVEEPKVQEVMFAILKAIENGQRNASLDRMNNATGKLALSGHLLRNFVKRKPGEPPAQDPSRRPPETVSSQSPDSQDSTGRSAPAPASPPKVEPPRTWTDSTGQHRVMAVFGGVAFGKVILRKADGTTRSVPIERLSEEDQEWIRHRRH
jgi:hypothetical protein